MNDEDFEKFKVELRRPIFTIEQVVEMDVIIQEHIKQQKEKVDLLAKKLAYRLNKGGRQPGTKLRKGETVEETTN